MAKVPTERVTVRLNTLHLGTIDALIQMGQIRNRSQAIGEAVRDYVNLKTVAAKQLQEAQKNQIDVQTMAAQLQEMQARLARLQKK